MRLRFAKRIDALIELSEVSVPELVSLLHKCGSLMFTLEHIMHFRHLRFLSNVSS